MNHPTLYPVTILTGFLGSGKTTLLNRLLRAPHGRKLAVIVNEFGDIGIDGLLVAGGEQFVELDNGCLCCAVNASLEATLHELRERGGFEHLIIETSGLADPLPVAWTFARKGLSQYYRVDSIVTVVDAWANERALAESIEAKEQIMRADILVVNKIDLVPEGISDLERRLRELNDIAPLIKVQFGDVPWDFVLDYQAEEGFKSIPEDPDHTHDLLFKSWSFSTDGVLSDRGLEDFCYALPTNIFRFKGVVRTDAEWPWTEVHGVAGRIDIRPYPLGEPKDTQQSHLVFIGKELDVAELEEKCRALVI